MVGGMECRAGWNFIELKISLSESQIKVNFFTSQKHQRCAVMSAHGDLGPHNNDLVSG